MRAPISVRGVDIEGTTMAADPAGEGNRFICLGKDQRIYVFQDLQTGTPDQMC